MQPSWLGFQRQAHILWINSAWSQRLRHAPRLYPTAPVHTKYHTEEDGRCQDYAPPFLIAPYDNKIILPTALFLYFRNLKLKSNTSYDDAMEIPKKPIAIPNSISTLGRKTLDQAITRLEPTYTLQLLLLLLLLLLQRTFVFRNITT